MAAPKFHPRARAARGAVPHQPTCRPRIQRPRVPPPSILLFRLNDLRRKEKSVWIRSSLAKEPNCTTVPPTKFKLVNDDYRNAVY